MKLYSTIKDPETNKFHSIYEKKGREIVNNYIHVARGGSVRNVNNSIKGKVIGSFEYFEIEAYTEYYDELHTNILDLLKLFIRTKVAQDIETIAEVPSGELSSIISISGSGI